MTLQCNASEKGLDAVLLQDHLIAYISRALSETKQGYAEMAKEFLAVVFGVEKFHEYTYGHPARGYPLINLLKQ